MEWKCAEANFTHTLMVAKSNEARTIQSACMGGIVGQFGLSRRVDNHNALSNQD